MAAGTELGVGRGVSIGSSWRCRVGTGEVTIRGVNDGTRETSAVLPELIAQAVKVRAMSRVVRFRRFMMSSYR
jgi:hypothetical protein